MTFSNVYQSVSHFLNSMLWAEEEVPSPVVPDEIIPEVVIISASPVGAPRAMPRLTECSAWILPPRGDSLLMSFIHPLTPRLSAGEGAREQDVG